MWAAMTTVVEIVGSDPIEVCGLPTEELFVAGDVLDNPKSVKAELKDDLSAYNAQMLENMAKFFQAQVESKSAGKTVSVTPDGADCTCWLPFRAISMPRAGRDGQSWRHVRLFDALSH